MAALGVVAARAATQSITIDEADTFLSWVVPSSPSHWEPASNNHVLNSLLIRLAVTLFGASHFTVRLPAIAGAILYVGASYCLCRIVARNVWRQWLLLACLIFNPFILDYLVAARGYGLALGFLMSALACAAHGDEKSRGKWCALTSTCTALSIAANFSFAFADAAGLLFLFLWIRSRGPRPRRPSLRLPALTVLPAMAVSLLLTAPTLAHWPKGQLWFGASSLRETFAGIVESSFYQLNPYVPLLTLIAAIAAEVTTPGFAGRCARAGLIWVMGFTAAYFLLSLRFGHFKEWKWDAEVNRVYPVLAYYNHVCGVRDVGTNWMYVSSLNFYRTISGRESLAELTSAAAAPPPAGKAVYVLHAVLDREFIGREGLEVVYHGSLSDVVVAVRRDMLSCREGRAGPSTADAPTIPIR